jgi:hypothetical protein
MSRDVEVMKVEMAKVMAMANVLDAANKQVCLVRLSLSTG